MSKKILLLQEKFDPASEVFERIVTLANTWNTTVDLLHYISLDEESKIQPGIPKDEAIAARFCYA